MMWMDTLLPALVVVAMLLTLFALFGGLFSMARGGEFNRRYGNRFMRWRVIMQFVALALFALAALMRH